MSNELILKAIESAKCRIYKLNFDMNGNISPLHQRKAENQKELMEATVEALEKQNPKFVECKEWKGIRNTRYKCPRCKKFVRNDESYCHKCGQAIMFPGVKQKDGKLELYWGD